MSLRHEKCQILVGVCSHEVLLLRQL